MWCVDAADALATALRTHPELRVVVVLPAYPDLDGRVSGPANRISQLRVLARLAEAGHDRFAAYDLERPDGWPIYIHAKLCIIDDVWMMVGSDNLNRRSWTHDSELAVAIIDTTLDERNRTTPEAMATEHACWPGTLASSCGVNISSATMSPSIRSTASGCCPSQPPLSTPGTITDSAVSDHRAGSVAGPHQSPGGHDHWQRRPTGWSAIPTAVRGRYAVAVSTDLRSRRCYAGRVYGGPTVQLTPRVRGERGGRRGSPVHSD